MSVDDVIGHCQLPMLAMQGEDRNQDLRYYNALNHLIHSTLRILSEKRYKAIPTENNRCFFLFQALQEDLQRAPPSEKNNDDDSSSDSDGHNHNNAPAPDEINQQNGNPPAANDAQAMATAQANAAVALRRQLANQHPNKKL